LRKMPIDHAIGLAIALMVLGSVAVGANFIFVNWSQVFLIAAAFLMIPSALIIYMKSLLSLRRLSGQKEQK